eukprot:13621874-Alexandrium_andersonii.AAC.1
MARAATRRPGPLLKPPASNCDVRAPNESRMEWLPQAPAFNAGCRSGRRREVDDSVRSTPEQ